MEIKERKNVFIFCTICTLIVFLVYAHTLKYGWKHFDEQIIFDELILPIPNSFSEIFEYLSAFGCDHLMEASNPFISTISNIRGTPIDVVLSLFIFAFFKKSAFAYHLFSLGLHLLNTIFCFLILNKVLLVFQKETSNNIAKYMMISVLTLLWALHPTHVESVLFATNYAALITYTLCFIIIFLYINLIEGKMIEKISPIKAFFVFLLYLIMIFINVYGITLPIIIGMYLFAYYRHRLNSDFMISAIESTKKLSPIIFALTVFLIHYFSLPIQRTSADGSMQLLLERIFWFSPQVLLHNLGLTFFPNVLSIDQSSFVEFGNSLFSKKAIFASSIMLCLIFLFVFSFMTIKNKISFYFFTLTIYFFLSYLPFSHILAPVYNITSERYLYFPIFFFIFGLSHLIFALQANKKINRTARVFLIIICILFSFKTYARTLDWEDSISLFTSAYTSAKNDLFKALRLQMTGAITARYASTDEELQKGKENIVSGLRILEKHYEKLEEEKKYLYKLPEIIKAYGLDPKTMQAKTAYIYASSLLALKANLDETYKILQPHMKDNSIIDTQILDLYLGILFGKGYYDEAEVLLNHVLSRKPSPVSYIAYAELCKKKYNDLVSAEKYLLKSFKLFPYDIQTLLNLRDFYIATNKREKYAFYLYLLGLRTHSKETLEKAQELYKELGNTTLSEKILKNLRKHYTY